MRVTLAVFGVLSIAAVARADVGMPAPSSCPAGSRPSSVPHYASWCEAATCIDDADCAVQMQPYDSTDAPPPVGYTCHATRGLCVRDHDVAGVGWASGHTQHLHEALSVCAAPADCPTGTTCVLASRCDRSAVVAAIPAPLLSTAATIGLPVLLSALASLVLLVVVIVLLRRRRTRR